MANYAVSVGNREYRVEVQDSHLLVDGEPVSFELTSLNGNGMHLFRRDTRHTEMYVKSPSETPSDAYEVQVHGHCLVARVENPYRRSRRPKDVAAAGVVAAPMPGLVVDVLVEPGQTVREGDVLLVQESMKMQMQLRAPCGGQVAALRVCAGDQVEKGTILAQVVAVS